MPCNLLNTSISFDGDRPRPNSFGATTDDAVASAMLPYPISFEMSRSWATAAAVAEAIALRRFIAYSVLRCIAGCNTLNRRLIVRGGCALWLRYSGQRPFDDIDFLCQDLDEERGSPAQLELIQEIDEVLCRELFKLFPQTSAWESFLVKQIKIEVAPAFASVPCRWVRLGPAASSQNKGLAIRVADLERILAEKLCGLLQHVARPNKRGKDVADISIMMHAHGKAISLATLKKILGEIATRRRIDSSIKRFDANVKQDAMASFRSAIAVTNAPDTTFASAWAQVMELVGRLQE